MHEAVSRCALVTGGSQGIGLATALCLARQGFRVWIAARSSERLAAAQQQAVAAGLSLQALQMDVSQLSSVETGFATLAQQGASPAVLVHAAGMGAFSELSQPDDPAHWQAVIQTNLTGAYYCTRLAALTMQAARWGRIVLVSSVLGLRGMRHAHAYCAAKHGLVGLARALAQDLAQDQITVNAVCPGWVETAMGKQSMSRIAGHYGLEAELFEQEELLAMPLQRWLQPVEVAELIKYLVSDSAAAINGQALEIGA